MSKIKNLIIDLGGVMIDLDRDRCAYNFEQLGLANANEMLGLYRQQEPFLSIETGAISVAEFYDKLRGLISKPVTDRDIEITLDSFLVNLPVQRLEALRRARNSGLKTYMLSNTNGIMYNGWIKRAFQSEGLQVGDYFDGIVTSFAEGVCKPDSAIFATVLKRYKLNPEETIMLDDSEANCKAAEGLGMHSNRITKENDIVSVIDRLIK